MMRFPLNTFKDLALSDRVLGSSPTTLLIQTYHFFLLPATYICHQKNCELLRSKKAVYLVTQNCNLGVTDSGRTQNSVPSDRVGKGFYGEKNKKVHAGLYKLFTKTWNWRINFYCTYKWFVEHISSLIGKYVFSLVQKNSSYQHYSLVLAIQQLFSG